MSIKLIEYDPTLVIFLSLLVHLVGIRSLQSPHKFTGFMLQVENDGGRSDNVGMFQLMGDTLAKFSERCPNLVTHTSAIPKTSIEVRWTAPPAGSGCVVFRATVIEHRDVWCVFERVF